MSNQWPPSPGYGPDGRQQPGGQQPGPHRQPYGQPTQPPPPQYQQPYGQPGPPPSHYPQSYGQQPPQSGLDWLSQGGGGGGGNGKKLMFALGGAGLVVVALVVAAIFVFGGGPGDAGADPEEALETFVAAIEDNDYDTIEGVTTDTFQEKMDIDSCESGGLSDVAGMEKVDLAAGEVEQDGDETTGTIEVTGAPGGADNAGLQVTMVEDDDGWKVDAFGARESGTRKL